MARLAFLGLGKMGGGMAARLLASGHDIAVWNRSPAKATALVAKGARLAATPRIAAGGAEAILAMVADDTAADAVWLGRATRWALGSFGPVGVQRLLNDIIFKELIEAAAATGKTTLASIDSSIVKQSWP